jgi:hypothetical protein
MSNFEDCRIGKELKQSTCRYVKECKRGWTRNDKFICRKTNRRLVSPKQFTTSDPSKAKRASRKSSNVESAPKKFTSANPKKAKTAKLSAIEEGNELSPIAPSRSTPNKTFTKLKSASKAKSKKYKVGDTFMYTHPDGRKEKATITRLGDNDRLELHIPSLANNWANYGAPKFKKNQSVFILFNKGKKSEMKEQGVIKNVHDGYYDYAAKKVIMPEYDVKVGQGFLPNVKEKFLRAFSDYKLLDGAFPEYVLKSA